MCCSTKRLLLYCVMGIAIGSLAPADVIAAKHNKMTFDSLAFSRQMTTFDKRLKGTKRAYQLRSLSRYIYKLDQILSSATIHPKRKQIMQGIVACMASYTVDRTIPTMARHWRSYNWYRFHMSLRLQKRHMASLLSQRAHKRRCLRAAFGTKAWNQRIAKHIHLPYMQRELKDLQQTLSQIDERLTKLDRIKTALLRSGKAGRRKLTRRAWRALHRRGEGLLLQVVDILFKRRKRRWLKGPRHAQRLRIIRHLWRLRPSKATTPNPINGDIPLLVHTTVLTTAFSVSIIALSDRQNVGNGPIGARIPVTSWMLLGGSVGMLAASPAMGMLHNPQPHAANVIITVASAGLVPAIGLSMAFTAQPEVRAFATGVLLSVPFHATWLIMGWINQSRWHAKHQQWQTPPPPRPTAKALMRR